jgi:ABC-type Fe3+ transport system substrate-binding protein
VKFINWLLSNVGQNAVATLGYTPALSTSTTFVATTATPTTTTSATPTTATNPLVAVNINQILSQRAAIVQQFRTIFLT